MIICYLLSHYLTYTSLPEYKKELYLYSDTTSCKVYSNRTWDIVDKQGNKIEVTNNTINVTGYFGGYV